jgi:hypothetical protein
LEELALPKNLSLWQSKNIEYKNCLNGNALVSRVDFSKFTKSYWKQNFMSLEQVNAFYELLNSDQVLYEQYYNKCSNKGVFGVWNWDKSKIVDFAASIGYNFTETELDLAWFGGDTSLCVGFTQ